MKLSLLIFLTPVVKGELSLLITVLLTVYLLQVAKKYIGYKGE